MDLSYLEVNLKDTTKAGLIGAGLGICIGIIFSIGWLCNIDRPVVIDNQEVSFLIKDFMGWENVHLIQLN